MTETALPTGDRDLVATIEDIIGDLRDDRQSGFDERIWASLVQSEIHLVGVPLRAGGVGGEFADVVAVAMTCARFGIAVPFVENHLAQWCLAESGARVADGITVLAPGGSEDRTRIAWGRLASGVVVKRPSGMISHVPASSLIVVREGEGLAGDPWDEIRWPDGCAEDIAGPNAVDRDGLTSRALILRSAQIAGAIAGCYELTRRYTRERQQFGRPLNAFQAVQRHLVELAEAAAITRLSVWRSVADVATVNDSAVMAKLVANEFARVAIRCSHQAHGAIGMTREYPLQRLTRRLHAWSMTDGASKYLAESAGARLQERGSSFLEVVQTGLVQSGA